MNIAISALALIACCSLKEFSETHPLINPRGTTIAERINTPAGYERVRLAPGSFGRYLRYLPLKPHGTSVRYHDGSTKRKSGVYCAVVDFDLDRRDLQQCADAVMRLRAEYLHGAGRGGEIRFTLSDGLVASYARWARGWRIRVVGGKTVWEKKAGPSDSRHDLERFLAVVYAYAGTITLDRDLGSPVTFASISPGDVLIRGGSPGHAVIVLDVAVQKRTGKKIFLLAQSYMPAQDIQVLVNPAGGSLDPWYEIPDGGDVITPEWKFTKGDLKRFSVRARARDEM